MVCLWVCIQGTSPQQRSSLIVKINDALITRELYYQKLYPREYALSKTTFGANARAPVTDTASMEEISELQGKRGNGIRPRSKDITGLVEPIRNKWGERISEVTRQKTKI